MAQKTQEAQTVTTSLDSDALAAARDLWRKHAPRRFWGLIEAKRQPASEADSGNKPARS
ncbi:MAG: hypothetical protein WA843_02050 [Candidatus Saccharimonadales bacterium]